MDRFDDDTLFDELRLLRPTPRPQFAAELDERAAAGFPRRSPSSKPEAPFARLTDWWRGLSVRGRLVPALGVAVLAFVVATTVVALSSSGGGGSAAENASLGMAEGGSVGSGSGVPAPETSAPSRHGHHNSSPTESGGTAVYEAEVPSVSSEGAVEEEAESESAGSSIEPFRADVPPVHAHRDIERSAYVVLGTKPGEVSAASAKVYTAVHAANGIVLHSSVQSGTKGATGATFQLLIPSAKLDDALAAFSSIAEVRERHDATNDITAPTVSAAEELADSNAAIDGLLKELADVETEAERESVEARLREERRRHASIRASLDHLNERAAMSEVTVRIVTGRGAGVTPVGKGSDGDWGVGDALHDAGHILTISASVILLGLAIVAPIVLIAFAVWLANRFRLRRLRERALG